MCNGNYSVPKPCNERAHTLEPGCPQRAALKAELQRQSGQVVTIPLIIGGKAVYTEHTVPVYMPHNHGHMLARCCQAGPEELELAVAAALEAKEQWENMPWHHRASIFLRAAELISGPHRAKLCAATMLGQSKTAREAEADAACELTDFLRFNVWYADQIYRQQPQGSAATWNRLCYRPLEGFVLAVTPFNFTAIGGNLATAPAICGNTVVWKPGTAAVLSNYYVMQALMEAGLPAGVINFVPCRGQDVSTVVAHPQLAGFHFTGSTEVFRGIWRQVGQRIDSYASFPRLVGETGGKDFLFAHASCHVPSLVAAMVRGAFEYQGQKCSALSRAFIPRSLWPQVEAALLAEVARLRAGDVADFRSFMGAVIDRRSFDTLKGIINDARASPHCRVLCGGYDDSVGYFVHPTVILAGQRDAPTMLQELFGPVLTVFVYEDDQLDDTLRYCNDSTPYALTGAIFACDRQAICHMEHLLRHAAGNLYINDKPTGAVVGQQPFGGGRASGTNDKAGSPMNLYRWMSLCTIKECFAPPVQVGYPSMLAP